MTFKQVAVLAAVLVGTVMVFRAERAAASDKYAQTLTSADAGPVSSTALYKGGRYAVQCDMPAYITAGAVTVPAAYLHLTADGGDAGMTQDVPDGGSAFGPLATTNGVIVTTNALYDVDLGSNESYIAMRPVADAGSCRVFYRNTPRGQ